MGLLVSSEPPIGAQREREGDVGWGLGLGLGKVEKEDHFGFVDC